MNIRKANPEDVSKIAEINRALHLDIPDFVWTDLEFIKKQVERGEYFVGEENGTAVGAMSLRERNRMLYIETLAVAKDIQSRGVGSKLVDFAKQFAKDSGFETLRTTSFYKYEVKDFWTKRGFGLLPEPGEYGGHKFYRFELKLND